jgi:hypothetical protein
VQQRLPFIGVTPILLATILAIIFVGSASPATFAAVQVAPSPTLSPSGPSGSAAERGLARVGALPPALAGKIIHFRTDIYQFAQGSPDPGNGQVIHADVW